MRKRPETNILSVPAYGIEVIFGRVPGGSWEVWDAGRPAAVKCQPRGSAPVAAFVRTMPYARSRRRAPGKRARTR